MACSSDRIVSLFLLPGIYSMNDFFFLCEVKRASSCLIAVGMSFSRLANCQLFYS